MVNSFDSTVEDNVDPVQTIRAAARSVAEKTPQMKAMLSGVVAHYHELEARDARLSAELSELKLQMGRAREAKNDEIGQLLAKQFVAKQNEQKQVQVELVSAAQAAKSAKDSYEDWKSKVTKIQEDALQKIDQNDQAAALETMSEARATIDSTNVTSEYSDASRKIDNRLARARAAGELDSDPTQSKIDEFRRQTDDRDAASVWESFKKENETPAATTA